MSSLSKFQRIFVFLLTVLAYAAQVQSTHVIQDRQALSSLVETALQSLMPSLVASEPTTTSSVTTTTTGPSASMSTPQGIPKSGDDPFPFTPPRSFSATVSSVSSLDYSSTLNAFISGSSRTSETATVASVGTAAISSASTIHLTPTMSATGTVSISTPTSESTKSGGGKNSASGVTLLLAAMIAILLLGSA